MLKFNIRWFTTISNFKTAINSESTVWGIRFRAHFTGKWLPRCDAPPFWVEKILPSINHFLLVFVVISPYSCMEYGERRHVWGGDERAEAYRMKTIVMSSFFARLWLWPTSQPTDGGDGGAGNNRPKLFKPWKSIIPSGGNLHSTGKRQTFFIPYPATDAVPVVEPSNRPFPSKRTNFFFWKFVNL